MSINAVEENKQRNGLSDRPDLVVSYGTHLAHYLKETSARTQARCLTVDSKVLQAK